MASSSRVSSYDLDEVLASGDLIRSHQLYPAALVLVLLGAFTKSAQFPFHFRLPRAMVVPIPVSAYLHSATMVKAGVFLLARLRPVLANTETWFWLVRSCSTGFVAFVPSRVLSETIAPADDRREQPEDPDGSVRDS